MPAHGGQLPNRNVAAGSAEKSFKRGLRWGSIIADFRLGLCPRVHPYWS